MMMADAKLPCGHAFGFFQGEIGRALLRTEMWVDAAILRQAVDHQLGFSAFCMM